MSNVNENIRNFRIFRGMSQRELARRLNKSANVVSNWENGIHSPDLDTIEEICKILRVSPDEVFGWKENEEYARHAKKMAQYRADIAALQDKRERIDQQIRNIETAMFHEENPLLDVVDEEGRPLDE